MPSGIAQKVAPEHRSKLHTPLTAEASSALQSMMNLGLMRPVLPDHIADALIQAGYAKQTFGGVAMTDVGQVRAMMENGQ